MRVPAATARRVAGIHGQKTFCRHQVRAAQVDSPWPVHARTGAVGLNQVIELFTERLRIAASLLVQDHQVGREPMRAPIGMRLEYLTDQAQIPRLTDGDQGNGQVTRDGISPQTGLALAVVGNALRGGAQERAGIEQMARQLLEAARFIGLDAQKAQLKLG